MVRGGSYRISGIKVPVVLVLLIGIFVLACSTVTPVPAEPTPSIDATAVVEPILDIDATVEARLAYERAVDATVQAKVSGTLSAPESKTPSTTQAVCKLTGGEPVESGWTGKDTGNNSCNSCFCMNGALGCTKMACPSQLSRPVEMDKPTPTRLVIGPTLVSIPTFEILSKHPTMDCLNAQFQMFVEVFGLYVAAPSSAPKEYVIHSANVLAEYIDNDRDGLPDDRAVLEHLKRQNLLVPVWIMSTREQFNQNRRGTECEDGVTLVASMYYDQDQWAIGGIESAGKWDTNLEEIWHIVSIGWYATYPEFFGGETSESSKLVNAMDTARGGRFFAIPDKYPDNAWYSYYDDTCDYACQRHEYFYWITMANIDALDPVLTSKCADSAHEWNVCNQSELKKVDALAFDLLNNHAFNLPTNIPNGRYSVN